MTKIQTLNTASDLRRIANWVARGEAEKLNLIKFLLNEIKDKKVKKMIGNFSGGIKPENSFKNKQKSTLFAEGMLAASFILKNRVFKS